MNRKNIIQIHLVLAAFLLPFLIHLPTSGVLYLLGQKGKANKELAFTVNNELKPTKEAILEVFKTQSIDFDFEYIKKKNGKMILRPSTKEHYEIVPTAQGHQFYKITPDFILKIVEMHKGHGPGLFKKFQIAAGIGFILITLSGLWLIFSVPSFLKISIISFAAGFVIFIGTLFL